MVIVKPRKVNALHIVPSLAAQYGGPSIAVQAMVNAWRHSNDVVAEIACTDADGPRKRLSLSEIRIDTPVHLCKRIFSERWKFSPELWTWLRNNSGKFDILHIHGLWSFSTAAAARVAKRIGVPYIIRPAGMLSEYTWNRNSVAKLVYWKLIEKHTLKGASAFHVTSNSEAAEVRSLLPEARIFIIPNGVEEDAFAQPHDPTALARASDQQAEHPPIILFLSRLHPKKGIIDRLLPAMAIVKTPCLLAIVGGEDSGATGHKREIQKAISRLGLERRVLMLGAVNGTARWGLFDGAALFILPSHSENFGIVVAEAMARSCPVVVTSEVQAAPLVEQAKAGIVAEGDIRSIAKAVDDLLTNHEDRTLAGARGQEFARRNLQWSNIATQVRSMYSTVLNQEKLR